MVRYSRQIIIPYVTPSGQASLKGSKVLIVGVGGLGCPASLYLASAGVGKLSQIHALIFVKYLIHMSHKALMSHVKM